MEQAKAEEAQKVCLSAVETDQELELLRKLIKKGVLELRPAFDMAGIRYPNAEEAWTIDSTQVKEVLVELEKKGSLVVRLAERALMCPSCGSPELHGKYTCPKCGSDTVELTELLEHTKCGYIGAKENFVKESGLACPSCHAGLLSETEHYRAIGNFYQCEKCGNRFDKPEAIYVCQNCDKVSSQQEAKYVKVYSYRISEERIREFGRELPVLENARQLLVNSGFKVKLHAKVTGASGVQSLFDAVAERGETLLVADISVSGNKNDIVALLAKKADVNPTKALIIDLSGLDELLLLGKIYDILVIKAAKDQSLPVEFGVFLAKLGVPTHD